AYGAGKAIQDEALAGVRLVDPLGNHPSDDVVGHQLPGIHDFLGGLAQFRTRGDRGPQHVAGGELHQATLRLEPLRLGTLPGAGRPEQNEVHPRRPLSLDLRITPSYWCAIKCDWICDTVSIVTVTTIRRLVPPK